MGRLFQQRGIESFLGPVLFNCKFPAKDHAQPAHHNGDFVRHFCFLDRSGVDDSAVFRPGRCRAAADENRFLRIRLRSDLDPPGLHPDFLLFRTLPEIPSAYAAAREKWRQDSTVRTCFCAFCISLSGMVTACWMLMGE
jgi:hypothetical protein